MPRGRVNTPTNASDGNANDDNTNKSDASDARADEVEVDPALIKVIDKRMVEMQETFTATFQANMGTLLQTAIAAALAEQTESGSGQGGEGNSGRRQKVSLSVSRPLDSYGSLQEHENADEEDGMEEEASVMTADDKPRLLAKHFPKLTEADYWPTDYQYKGSKKVAFSSSLTLSWAEPLFDNLEAAIVEMAPEAFEADVQDWNIHWISAVFRYLRRSLKKSEVGLSEWLAAEEARIKDLAATGMADKALYSSFRSQFYLDICGINQAKVLRQLISFNDSVSKGSSLHVAIRASAPPSSGLRQCIIIHFLMTFCRQSSLTSWRHAFLTFSP
jgi:hypothetical protein